MGYHVNFVSCHGDIDVNNLNYELKKDAESGYVLHSVVPKVDEGQTIGYFVIYDASSVDC